MNQRVVLYEISVYVKMKGFKKAELIGDEMIIMSYPIYIDINIHINIYMKDIKKAEVIGH